MRTFFSNSSKKPTPKNLEECMDTSLVTSKLWSWSDWIERVGTILCALIIILGLIISIANSITTEKVESFSFVVLLTSLITWGFYAFFEYCAYRTLALLIAALASIVQDTKISARVALYKAAKEESETYPYAITEE